MKRVFRISGAGRPADRALDDELRFHLEGRVDELMQSEGLARDEAEREARRRFGDYEAYRRQAREIDDDMLRRRNRMELFDTITRELRHAARTLWRSRAFSAINLITLAAGIGATTAIYTVLDAVVLRPLPYRNADRLVSVLHPATVPGQRRIEVGIVVSGIFLLQERESHAGGPRRLPDRHRHGDWDGERRERARRHRHLFDLHDTRRARRVGPADLGRRRSAWRRQSRRAEPRVLGARIRRRPRGRRQDAPDERRRLSDHRRRRAGAHASQTRTLRVHRRSRRLRRRRLVSGATQSQRTSDQLTSVLRDRTSQAGGHGAGRRRPTSRAS